VRLSIGVRTSRGDAHKAQAKRQTAGLASAARDEVAGPLFMSTEPSTNGLLADQAARDQIRSDLDTTLVVEAAAGTGKTSELVRRMISVIKTGRAQLDSMAAVTFTDAAAGELKLRLRAAIETERGDSRCSPDERTLLRLALPQLEEARIGTIHSFCADLLRERPVEAGIDPMFEVAADDVARPLFDIAFDRWFERQL